MNHAYTAGEIKKIMADCYDQVGVEKTPIVSDLEKMYGFMVRRGKETHHKGSRTSVYYISA